MNKIAIIDTEVEALEEKEIITRFGSVKVRESQIITFPLGLLGIPQEKKYYLTAYPDEKVHSYSLLQGVEKKNLCFLTVPLANEFFATEDGLIAHTDIRDAKEHYNIKNLAVLLIATIHNNKKKNASRVSVNLKAPILIDTDELVAYQHVFVRKEYSLKFYLN